MERGGDNIKTVWVIEVTASAIWVVVVAVVSAWVVEVAVRVV